MKSDPPNTDKLEAERQELLNGFGDQPAESLRENFGPGSLGCHELLDRTALLVDLLEEKVVTHSACIENPRWFALAREAATILHRLYQEIGSEHLGKAASEGHAPKNPD